MCERIYVLLEIVNIVLCLHYLWGKKPKINLVFVNFVGQLNSSQGIMAHLFRVSGNLPPCCAGTTLTERLPRE